MSIKNIMEHPLISGYGKTFETDFPLILVVGREPNTELSCNKSLGNFDFIKWPRCAFWNTAFSILGRSNNITISEVKKLFKEFDSSPLVFTDALPFGIKNHISNKFEVRKNVNEDVFLNQVEDIFHRQEIIQRTSLILLSGLQNRLYKPFKLALKEKAAQDLIRVAELPFFYPTNTPKIVKQLGERDIEILKDVFKKYLKSTAVITTI